MGVLYVAAMAACAAQRWWAIWAALAGSWAVILAAVVERILHNPMCDFLFRCGCVVNWKGGWNNCNIHNPEGPHCPFCESAGWYAWITWLPATVLMAFTIWWCALAAPIMLARWRLRYFSIDAERVEVNQRTTVLRVDREDDLYEQGIEGIDLDKKDCSGRQSPAIEGNNWHLNVLSKTE